MNYFSRCELCQVDGPFTAVFAEARPRGVKSGVSPESRTTGACEERTIGLSGARRSVPSKRSTKEMSHEVGTCCSLCRGGLYRPRVLCRAGRRSEPLEDVQ